MNALLLEFVDEEINETTYYVDERDADRLRVFRPRYLELLETARASRVEWLLREGTDFQCEACKSFTLPAKGLYMLLARVDLKDRDSALEDLIYMVRNKLVKPYPMTDEAWKEYTEGRLGHIPFLYDKKGELEWEDESGPSYLTFDDVVFKFRSSCDCDNVYRGMYGNLARYFAKNNRAIQDSTH